MERFPRNCRVKKTSELPSEKASKKSEQETCRYILKVWKIKQAVNNS